MRKILAVLITLGITSILLIASLEMPEFGSQNAPAHNEVSQYYIENATKDTGATNVITGVILDYRAFDTFVEASVLFTSAIVVMLVLKKEKSNHS